jgi:hypothetical protein
LLRFGSSAPSAKTSPPERLERRVDIRGKLATLVCELVRRFRVDRASHGHLLAR